MGADDAGTSMPMCSNQPWRQTPISSNQTAGFGNQMPEEDSLFLPDTIFTADMAWSRLGTNQFVNGPVFHGVRLDMSMFDKFLKPKPRPTLVPYHPILDANFGMTNWKEYFSYPIGEQYGSHTWFPNSNVVVYTPPRVEVLVPLPNDPLLFPTMMMPWYQEELPHFGTVYNWGLDFGFPSTSLLLPPTPPRPPSPFNLIDRIDQLHLSGRMEIGSWNADAFPNSSHVTVASDSDSDYIPTPQASRRPSIEREQAPPLASRPLVSPPVFHDPTPMVIDHFMGEPQVRTGHRNYHDNRRSFRPLPFHHNNNGSPGRRGRGFHHGPPRGPTPPRPAPSRPSPPRQPVLVARPASNPQNPVRQAPGRPAPIRQYLPTPIPPMMHWGEQRPRPRRLEDMKLNEVLGLDGEIRQERRDGARNRNRQTRKRDAGDNQ